MTDVPNRSREALDRITEHHELRIVIHFDNNGHQWATGYCVTGDWFVSTREEEHWGQLTDAYREHLT